MRTFPDRPVFDANANAGGKDLGSLPEWNLDDLYTAEDAPANTEGGAEERDDAADSASECPERVEAAPVTIDDIIEPEEASEQTDGETQDEDDSSPLDWSEPEES